jgi:hypothetical protein
MTPRHLRLALLAVATLAGWSLAVPAATLTRTSAFDYDAGSGLLTKEIVEPGDSNLCLVTEYQYDGYGNKTGATTRNCNGSSGSVPGSNSEAPAPPPPATATAAAAKPAPPAATPSSPPAPPVIPTTRAANFPPPAATPSTSPRPRPLIPASARC